MCRIKGGIGKWLRSVFGLFREKQRFSTSFRVTFVAKNRVESESAAKPLPKKVLWLAKQCVTVANMKKGRIEDVMRTSKVVDQVGRVHIPKRFLEKLGIKHGDEVEVAFFPIIDEIRIKKKGDRV